MNGFQITIIAIFIVALLVGVLVFAGVLPGFRAPTGGLGGTVIWWGTIPAERLNSVLEKARQEHQDQFSLVYVEKNPETLENDLVEALALGRGPDLVTLSSDILTRQAAKLQQIPYETFSKQTFKDTFVLGTHIRDWELLFGPDGVYGWPVYVDPLVLFYNQDLLANAKVPSVPRTWKDLATVNKLLTQTDGRGNISQSGIAIGTFSNISNAKELLSLLIMQAGNPIVARAAGLPKVTLKEALGFSQQPASEALAFFLRFTDPANTLYAWNSSQPEAREAFLRGKLAMYLGWGSEIDRLAAQNPQLNFYIATPPQREGGSRQLTLGRFHFLALARGAANPNTAIAVANLLSGPDFAALVATAATLPPARNDLLATLPADPDQSVLYQAAVIARDWLDPAPDKTRALWRQMAESLALGRVDPSRAVSDASAQLQDLLPANNNE